MKKRILSLALASAMTVGTVSGAFAETEAPEVLNGPQYIKGNESGEFMPNSKITRQEIAVMVGRALELEGSNPDFKDAAKIAGWADEFVAGLQDAGVVKGDDLGNFNPTNKITRAELAAMVVRAYEKSTGETLSEGDTSFDDVSDSAWYAKEVKKAAEAGLVKGNGEGSFNPMGEATRAETVMMVNRMLGLGEENLPSDVAELLETSLKDQAQWPSWAVDAILIASSAYEYTVGEDGKIVIKGEDETDLSVESIVAINNTTVEVDFKEEIDDIEALNFTIEGLKVSNAAVKQTDKTVAVLTTDKQDVIKYTVKEGDTVLGTFTGVSAVTPTGIKSQAYSVQSAVGKEVTLKANVTVPEGQSAAGIKVTFNVDANDSDDNLNEDKVVEVVTDANGVASYTYTQYAAGIDTVAVYPTGAPDFRDISTVYWGKTQILTVTEKEEGNVSNQDAKVYNVKLVHPTTGEPLRGVELGVTFAENVDTTALGTDAVATDPLTNESVVPYQSSTGERILEIKTNVNGEASFTVTGKNTKATPVVFLDERGVGAANALDGTGLRGDADGRWDARELQAVAPVANFVGVQQDYKIAFDITSPTEAVTNQAKEYKFQVFKADGTTPWAGGTVYVGFDELQDNVLTTNTTATILANNKVEEVVSGGTVARIELDSQGKGSFDVVGGLNVTATPTAWVNLNDQSAAGNIVREAGEAFANAGSITFRDEVASNVILDLNNDGNGDVGHNGYYADIAGTEGIAYELRLRNQNNNLTTTAKMDKVTYVVRNTGSKAVTVTFATPNWTPDQNIAAPITIAAGNSFTLSGNANGNAKIAGLAGVNTAGLTVTPVVDTDGTIEVSASATTLSVAAPEDANNRNNGLNLASAKMTAVWVDAQEVNQELTGEVVGYRTLDAAPDNGYVVVKLDGVDGYAVYKYNATENFYVGTQDNFASLTKTTINAFEERVSLGDRISINANALDGIRLINKDDSKDADQDDANTVFNADQAAATAVENTINALPAVAELTVADEAAVNAAKAAYDALTAAQKALVDPAVKAELDAAVAKIAELKGETGSLVAANVQISDPILGMFTNVAIDVPAGVTINSVAFGGETDTTGEVNSTGKTVYTFTNTTGTEAVISYTEGGESYTLTVAK